MGMKFTNNRKKAVNLNPKTEGKYSWENGDVAFGKKEPDPFCPHCKGSGAIRTGENEYSTCPCVGEIN